MASIDQKRLKSIARKARRFQARNKQKEPAKFKICKSDHAGTVLLPNLGRSL